MGASTSCAMAPAVPAARGRFASSYDLSVYESFDSYMTWVLEGPHAGKRPPARINRRSQHARRDKVSRHPAESSHMAWGISGRLVMRTARRWTLIGRRAPGRHRCLVFGGRADAHDLERPAWAERDRVDEMCPGAARACKRPHPPRAHPGHPFSIVGLVRRAYDTFVSVPLASHRQMTPSCHVGRA